MSDSGTGTMSSRQWAAMATAREDFSGQASHEHFVSAAREIFGFEYIQPVHQGRAAENLLFRLLFEPGDVVLSNTFFDTTRSNIEVLGCEARDLPARRGPWCGDIDLDRLESTLRRNPRAALVVLSVTNKSTAASRSPSRTSAERVSSQTPTASRSLWTPAASPATPTWSRS